MKEGITIGLDMGDRNHQICVLDAAGEVVSRVDVANTAAAIRKYFEGSERCRVAMEAGTHSGWVSRILEELGYEVLVGNPRKLRLIWDSEAKSDRRDAELLARIARLDPQLLHPIHHRSAKAQTDLAVIKVRDMLVRVRATLIVQARGLVKATGYRISSCSAESFAERLQTEMPGELRLALEPLMKSVAELTVQIRHCDRTVEQLGQDYPITQRLRTVPGVGPVTAVAYVLVLEDCKRFTRSRDVGPFLGLTPKRDQSGQTDKQLRISKAGDTHLRRLLVNCAQYMLGPFGQDSDLRRWGLQMATRGGKNAKRRAVVAVARKLAVLLHALWKTGATYEPFRPRLRRLNAA